MTPKGRFRLNCRNIKAGKEYLKKHPNDVYSKLALERSEQENKELAEKYGFTAENAITKD